VQLVGEGGLAEVALSELAAWLPDVDTIE